MIELVCDSLFLVDVILTFFTGVRSSEAKNMIWLRKSKHIDLDDDVDLGYVSNLRVIATIYLRTSLIVDLIALFPFFTNEWVFYGSEGWAKVYYLKGIRLLFRRSLFVSIDRILDKMN